MYLALRAWTPSLPAPSEHPPHATLLSTQDGSTRTVDPDTQVRPHLATLDAEDGNMTVHFDDADWVIEHRRDWHLVKIENAI